MIVRVTETDIARGEPDRSDCCPVALALMAMGYDVHVGVYSVELYSNGRHVDDLELPGSAVAFIDDFDAGRHVGPFEFELQTEHLNPDCEAGEGEA